MAIKLFWRCEGTTLDATHDYSAGATTASAITSCTLDASAAKVGSNGILADGTSELFRIAPTSIVNRLTGCVGLWVYYTTLVSGSGCITMRDNGSANNSIGLTQTGTGGAQLRLNIRDATAGLVTLDTDGAGMTTGNWYFVVGRWDQPNNKRKVEVYNASLALIDSAEDTSTAYTAPASLTGANGINMGEVVASANNRLYIDNVFIGDAYDDKLVENANITSWTEWSDGASGVTVTAIDDDIINSGQTGVTITGTGFGASQGTGKVIVCPTNDVDDASAVEQTVTSWADTSIDFTAVKGGLTVDTDAYLFVINDGAESNASGAVIQFTNVKKLKLLAHSSAASATGVDGVVFNAPTGGALTGTKIGEFTNKSFEASLESGKAVLKVPASDFGGTALTTSDTPVAYVQNDTYHTPLVSCTVVEE